MRRRVPHAIAPFASETASILRETKLPAAPGVCYAVVIYAGASAAANPSALVSPDAIGLGAAHAGERVRLEYDV